MWRMSGRAATDTWVQAGPDGRVVAFNVDFGYGGNSRKLAKEGWSTPEESETWSIGGTSQLSLPAPGVAATYVMVLKLRPHTVDGRLSAQRLIVVVNGLEIARFVVPRRTLRACRIPWTLIAGSPVIDITFLTPDAARPAESGGSADRRLLGVAFSQLQLYGDAYEGHHTDIFTTSNQPVPVDIDSIMLADQISLHDLMLKFESLGQNCEFGLVQRQCKAEPLGLLRFSSTPLPKLLAALEAGFAGMGLPETLQVEVSSNGREFMINDTRFGFLYHAFVEAGAMSVEDLHAREVRRVPFLIRKLLEDLEAGEKIFVFKGMGAMEEEEVFPLAVAIRRYGPNTLLFINLADATHKPGTVEVRAPGFLVGYVDRFAPTENAADFQLAQWVRICREAYRFRLATRRA
jgi:hypothetical protein